MIGSLHRWLTAMLLALVTATSVAAERSAPRYDYNAHPIPAFVLHMTEIVCDVLVNPEFDLPAPVATPALGCSKHEAGSSLPGATSGTRSPAYRSSFDPIGLPVDR
jgi:hypothetical protein